MGMGRFDACGLPLVDSALVDERAHVTVVVQFKNFQIDISAGGLKVASTIFGINTGSIRTASDERD